MVLKVLGVLGVGVAAGAFYVYRRPIGEAIHGLVERIQGGSLEGEGKLHGVLPLGKPPVSRKKVPLGEAIKGLDS